MTIILTCLFLLTLGQVAGAEPKHRIGAGLYYWKTIDKIDVSDIDENGFSGIISYQYLPLPLLKFEADMEFIPDGYAGYTETALTPQVYVIVGAGLYAGLGIGITYADGELADSPFYALRAGIDIEVLPSIYLDINANYRFDEWNIKDIEKNIDADTVTIGAVMRFEF